MRIIYIAVLVVLFAGCKSKYKLTTESREQSDRIESTVAIENEQIQKDSTGIRAKESESRWEEDRETDIEVKVTEYDTSKPVVESTGKPPVLRETITTKKEKKKDREAITGREVELNTAITHADRTTEIKRDVQEAKEATAKTHETRKRKSGGIWFWCGAGSVLVLSWWMLKRKII